jgi:hypothetical protein
VRHTALALFCFIAALPGCATVPAQPPPPPPTPPRPQHTVRLFEEIQPGHDAIREAVLRHVPVGTPIAPAQAALEGQGFTCRHYQMTSSLFLPDDLVPRGVFLHGQARQHIFRERANQPVFARVTLPELQDWHQRDYTVVVVLIPDAAQTLQDVEVGLGTEQHRHAAFFEARPALREPVGLPLVQAGAHLQAFGFHLAVDVPARAVRDPRPGDGPAPVVYEAFDESFLGGQIVRVCLFADQAGIVREAQVLSHGGWFDAERCMLPRDDSPPAEVAWRTVLFPARVGCRYGAAAALLSVGTAATLALRGLY